MFDSVGTRPDSVVNRRGRLVLGSWEAPGWGRRVPFLGDETRVFIGGSFRGDCWVRKRISSIFPDKTTFVHAAIGRGRLSILLRA